MKALILEAYNKLVFKEVPDPVIENDEVLVRVMACGICGSDVHGMDGSTGRRIPPVIMGHEASGMIVKTGKEVNGWKSGDRVTFDSTVYPLYDWFTLNGHYNLSDNREVLGVSPGTYRRNGAFAEFIAIPQHILCKVPNNVTFEQAAMVEAVGKSESVNTALNIVRKGGTAVLVGNTSPLVEFPLQQVVTREIKVQGSCAIRGEYNTILELIGSGRITVDDQISAVAPLSDGDIWFEKLYKKEGNLNKIILVP